MSSLAKALLVFAPLVSGSGVCPDGACQRSNDAADDQPSLVQLDRPAKRNGRVSRATRQVAQPKNGDRQQELLKKLNPLARLVKLDKQPYSCPLPTEDCHLGDDEKCDLVKMSQTAVHAVYPHGATMCLNSEAPYHFLVKRGNPTKLLISFEAGGACWDQDAYEREEVFTCEKEPVAEPWDGMLDFSNPHNPYHGYTIVRILYCSGDLYAGNGQQDWAEGGTKTVYFRGYENTKATLQWASEQFPNLQKLAIMGNGAGALALQYWTEAILHQFEDRKPTAVVHVDSYAGIIFPTDEANMKLLQKVQAGIWGTCENGALSPENQAACLSGDFTWQGHFGETMEHHEDVLFALINSKADHEQIGLNSFFYTFPVVPPTAQLTPSEWYLEATLLLKAYTKANPKNVRVYFVDGDLHRHLPKKSFFTATPLGAEADSGHPSLLSWISGFEAYKGGQGGPSSHPPCHVCIGEKVEVTGRDQTVPEGNTWCEANFVL